MEHSSQLILAFSTYLESDMQHHDNSFPTGVAVTKSGRILVADNQTNCVKMFSKMGEVLGELFQDSEPKIDIKMTLY